MSNIIDFYFKKVPTNTNNTEKPDKDAVTELLKHPKTSVIRQHERSKKFIYRGKVYNGLMSTIKKKFLVPSLYEAMYKNNKQRKTASTLEIGKRVHRQIHHMVMCKDTCDCETRTIPSRLNKWTKAFFAWCESQKIVPVATEVPIVCEKRGFATRIDFMGKQDGTLTVKISLKTGHDYATFDSSIHRLNSPYDKIPATYRVLNQIQSLYEDTVLYQDYGLRFDKSYVVYVGINNSPTGDEIYVDTEFPQGMNIKDEKLLEFMNVS